VQVARSVMVLHPEWHLWEHTWLYIKTLLLCILQPRY